MFQPNQILTDGFTHKDGTSSCPSKKEATMIKKTLVEVLQEAASIVEFDDEMLQKNLERAKKDFPKLIRAYAILALYAQHLEAESRVASRTGSVIPVQYLREVDWFEFLAEAAMDEFLEGDPEEYPEVRACPIIKQDYNAAVRCVQRFIDQLPQTEAEWDEYHSCLDALERHAAEMEAKGCK
jgi:hypothetical protein